MVRLVTQDQVDTYEQIPSSDTKCTCVVLISIALGYDSATKDGKTQGK